MWWSSVSPAKISVLVRGLFSPRHPSPPVPANAYFVPRAGLFCQSRYCRVFALVGSEPSRAAPYRRPSLFADCCRLLRRPPIRGDSRLWSRPGRLSVSLPALRLRQFLRLRRAHPPPFGRWVPFFFINKRPSVRFAISGAAARGVSRPAAAFYYGAPPLCPGLRVVKKQERPLPLLLIV